MSSLANEAAAKAYRGRDICWSLGDDGARWGESGIAFVDGGAVAGRYYKEEQATVTPESADEVIAHVGQTAVHVVETSVAPADLSQTPEGAERDIDDFELPDLELVRA